MIFDFDLQTEIHTKSHIFRLNAQCQSPAQRIAIVGASGSGKSLTLRMLAGLAKPRSGSLKINGVVYGDTARKIWLSPQQRRVGVVFQDYALFPHLTVAQNVAFGLRKNWLNPPKNPDEKTAKWLEKMQILHLSQHYPHQISGGQQQRVALARACIVQPNYLLLDEPFSALDADLRHDMRMQISDLQKELNIPMLLITHDLADCEHLADEVWQMKNGELAFQAASK